MEGENEDGAISTGLAKRAPTDARVPRGLPRGAGKGARGGVRGWGWKLRTRVATPRGRTDERATKGISDGPAPLEQLPSSSFRVVSPNALLDIPSVSAAFAATAPLKKAARSENPRAHAPFEKITLGLSLHLSIINQFQKFTKFVFHE